MLNTVKTTVNLPEEILLMAKYRALQEKITLGNFIKEAIEEKAIRPIKIRTKNPLRHLGKLSIGINKIYNKRSDLYDDYIRRKMGL